MRFRRFAPRSCLAVLLLASISLVAAAGDDLELIEQTSSGAYEIDGETRLIIQGIVGTLSLRGGKPGSLQFEGRRLDAERQRLDVALWRSGKHTLMLGPGSEIPEEGTLVDMAIPPELKIEVVIADGRVMASGLFSDLKLDAKRSRVQARGLRGGADLVIEGGQLAVDGVKLPFSYQGTDVNADIKHLYQDATINVTKGRLLLEDSEGGVEGYFTEADVGFERVAGRVRLEGSTGSLRLIECAGGGELHLEEAPLVMSGSKGDFEIRTDAEAGIEQHDGALNLVSYGGEVTASEIQGPLTIESDSATVILKQLGAQSEIRGSGLDLRVNGAKAPVTVNTVSSQISIQATHGDVSVANDFGDVEVGGGEGRLKIDSRSGIVRVTGHAGPLELKADGPAVEVTWVKFTKTDKVVLHNESGPVRVYLPPNGRCHLRAEAPYGEVDADLEGITVADDRRSASGEFTGGRGRAPQLKKPVIQVSSGGDNVYVGISDAASEN